MDGWFKLHRKITESPVFTDPELLRLWLLCLAKATYKETSVVIDRQQVTLLPGEFITGRKSLTNDYNVGLKPRHKKKELSLWRDLKFLEECGNLNIKSTNKYSVISIVKWSEYQENEQQLNNNRTTDEQQLNTNKKLKNLISTTTTEIEQEEPETLLSTYTKVFKALTMDGLTSDFFMKLRNQGYTERFCIELLLEAGESCQGAKPSLRYMESIRDRWIKEKIYTRIESKARKEQSHKVTPLIPNVPKPTVASDEEMKELEEMARRAAERNRASNQ
jgi:hypothetical protein